MELEQYTRLLGNLGIRFVRVADGILQQSKQSSLSRKNGAFLQKTSRNLTLPRRIPGFQCYNVRKVA